ncbi:MAG TPA: DPP IV N-terminal domain-containing protein, partial [Pyrinomonadaceae bacterium]
MLLTFASILIALTALCFGGAARAAAPEPSPTPPPLRASGLIAFKHLENFYEGEEIFTVNPDGTGRAKLIGLYGRQEDPAWSPDGKYIAYASGHRGYGEIWRADADGSNQISLSDGVAVRAVDDWPAWSPDGEKIVFVRNRQLWTIGRDGGTAVKLSTGSDEDEQPSWSPDGTKIAFVRDYSSATAQIWVMDADGSNQRNLSNYEWGFSRYPAWSPDGSRIAFQRWNDIWVMDADGSNQTQLTFAASGGYLKPAWSPDGSRLVVTNGINFEGEIFVMNADGSGITKIADGVHPTWQSLPPLTLTAADSPGRVTPGAELTYTLEVTNNHTLTAAGATLTDALDAGATFVLAETTRGSCATPAAGETGTVTCSLGDLAEGDRATVRVVVRVAAADGATLRNAATASAGYAGYGRQSQSAETATRVFTPPADLSVYAWINGGAYVSAGGQVVYGVSVFNSGPATAAGVTLTASLPEGVTLDTIDDAGGGECASEAGGRGFTCTFASVGVYEGRDLRVKATSNVAGEPYMPVTAAFNVAAATPDVTPDNNASTAAFFIAAPPLPAPTPGAADEALLAYGKQPLSDGQYDLYRQRADGTGTVKLTDDANYEDRFTWSPDGSRLAFLRHHFEDGFVSLGTVAADGSGLRMLTSVPGEYIVSVSWSPDGSRLVFDATPYTTNVGDPYVADVFVINADGTGRANLTNGDGFNSDPSWSPDGTRVAYTRGALAVGDGAPSGEIRVAGADGSGLVRIPQAAGEYDFTPHWSPDGARLAFTRRLADGTSYVQTVGADGTGPRRLTERPATDEANPQWSPDGSKVLFDSYDRAAGVPKIEVINAD